jgi:hypothetical protein
MANNDDGNNRDWVDERLDTLKTTDGSEPDIVRARAKLRARQIAPTSQKRGMWLLAAAATCLVLAALPWPRALAQQLWDRLVLSRIAVVQVGGEDLPDDVAAMFIMEPRPFDQEPVADQTEAERIAGFRPLFPPDAILSGKPALSIVKRAVLATRPLRIADMERALASAGVSDIAVPTNWEGLTLIAEAGPVVVADYAGIQIMQSAPFRMNTPPGFEFGRFMEMAFRVFGRGADEAKMLGAKFEANPGLVLHFPERAPVRDVALRSGNGIIVGDLNSDELICFFWNTPDRIYIVSATNVSEQRLVALADSIRCDATDPAARGGIRLRRPWPRLPRPRRSKVHVDRQDFFELHRLPVLECRLVAPALRGVQEHGIVHRPHGLSERHALDGSLLIDDNLERSREHGCPKVCECPGWERLV